MIKKTIALLTLCLALAASTGAWAAPRDAEAVLNRCGRPLRGDEIVYDNSIAGGHRILKYERGFVYFDKMGGSGWTFNHATHGKSGDLTADQMTRYLPCLKDALADSATPAPIKKITSVQRVEVSMKRAYGKMILYTLLFLAVLGGFFFLWSRRKVDEDDLVH